MHVVRTFCVRTSCEGFQNGVGFPASTIEKWHKQGVHIVTFTETDIQDMVLSAFEQSEVKWSGEDVFVRFGRRPWFRPTPELLTQGFEKMRAMRRPGARRMMDDRNNRTTTMAAFLAVATGAREEFENLVSELEG
jgi:hypothetical protein